MIAGRLKWKGSTPDVQQEISSPVSFVTLSEDTGDNGVHASASPFEALAERSNWLRASVSKDAFGKALLASGIPLPLLTKEWFHGSIVWSRLKLFLGAPLPYQLTEKNKKQHFKTPTTNFDIHFGTHASISSGSAILPWSLKVPRPRHSVPSRKKDLLPLVGKRQHP